MPDINAISRLQEFCLQQAKPQPVYEDRAYDQITKFFVVRCSVGSVSDEGRGATNKEAKRFAALSVLSKLISHSNGSNRSNHNDEDAASSNFDFTKRLSSLSLNDSKSLLDLKLRGVKKGENAESSLTPIITNPISALKEYCQQKFIPPPAYFVSTLKGKFTYECSVNGEKTYGEGRSKKSAKSKSAESMCQTLQIKFHCDGIESADSDDSCAEELYQDKNAVSALQEYCATMKPIPHPVPMYENKYTLSNGFTISCSVGTLSGLGSDLTKKGAKQYAAKNVLMQIIQRDRKSTSPYSESDRSMTLNNNIGLSRPKNNFNLVEFGLDDEDTYSYNTLNSSGQANGQLQNTARNNLEKGKR